MRKFVILFLCVAAAFATPASAKTSKAQKAKYVVLIGSDGFSSAVIRRHPGAFPNIERLMRKGSLRRSVLPSASAINWAAMLMGVGTEQHGYLTWGSKTPDMPSRVIGKYGISPGICGAIREAQPKAVMVCGYNWPTIGCLYEQKAVDFNFRATSDKVLADSICLMMAQHKPNFTFMAFDAPDCIGHASGWESEEYLESCKTIDSYVGKVLKTLDDNGMTSDAIVLFTADHGGINMGHGGTTMDEMECPFIVWGKGINRGHTMDESVMVYDCAATIGYIFRVHQPQVWIGRPVMSAFE